MTKKSKNWIKSKESQRTRIGRYAKISQKININGKLVKKPIKIKTGQKI